MNEVNRRVVLGGAAAAVALSAIPDVSWADGGDGGVRPVRLTAEHVRNPLGIEAAAPRFGWQLTASGTGRSQCAYRILVASKRDLVLRGRPDVWDSGRVVSGEQSGQRYAGGPLRSRTRYYWAVQAWDEHNRPGPVSEPAWFETAFLSDEWKAVWIGSGIVVPPPVKTLPQYTYETVTLAPGHTLGQTFKSESQMVALTVLLALTGTAGCTMTLRRTDPDGPVVHSQVLSGLTPDRYGQAQGRMDFPRIVEPGSYYLELSGASGDVGWKSILSDRYDGGQAYVDGKGIGHDRWVYSIPPKPPANPLLRNEFSVSGNVISARLYICGLGYAVSWMNGQRVDDSELTPPGTDYDRRQLYTTYDVTSLVQQGKNVIGVALGRGMFATREPDTDESNLTRWVAEPQVKAELEIVTSAGRTVIATGPSWQITEGPVVAEGVFSGETYDARRARELNGWASPGFDARDWKPAAVVPSPGGRLEAYTAEPIRASDAIRPVKVSVPAEGIRLYDFGTMLAGHARLRARLPEGTTVRLLYGEKLGPDGRVNIGIPGGNENNSVDGRYQCDEYIADGSEAEWEASFTYKTFRYLEVSGTTLPIDVVGVPVGSALESTMDIQLAHPELQWIADAFKRTVANVLRGHPDIGRFGWTSGGYRAVQPMLYQFGAASLFGKWLEDIRLSQGADGEIPLIAPMGVNQDGYLLTPSSTGVYPYLVHRYWLTYGDKTVPEKHFDGVRRYVGWVLGKLQDGVIDDRFGDWYPPGSSPMAPEGGTLVGTAYVIETLRSAIAIASVLGRTEQARTWQARTDELIRNFNAVFLEAGNYRTAIQKEYRQTSNAVPLAFGLVPAAVRDQVVANLAADVEARGRHLNTGALGTGALPFALSDNGRPDLATAVLTRTTYPSYGYLRSLGATTFWESWEATSRGHQDPTLSMPVRWLVERAVGVSMLEAGWTRFRVAPVIHESIPSARVVLDTVRGRVEAGWQRRGGAVVVDVRVPVNSVAEVILPNGVRRELGSGQHRI